MQFEAMTYLMVMQMPDHWMMEGTGELQNADMRNILSMNQTRP